MLVKYCAAQAVTTDIDVEIDQCQTVPPSNYDLSESQIERVVDPRPPGQIEGQSKQIFTVYLPSASACKNTGVHSRSRMERTASGKMSD